MRDSTKLLFFPGEALLYAKESIGQLHCILCRKYGKLDGADSIFVIRSNVVGLAASLFSL